jgi:homoserine O-acetyltransferase/O-succinyltransferase
MTARQRFCELGELALESGEAIRDFRQSYVVHGALNAARDNAVLVCSSIAGTAHRLDFLIGPGLALDPARFFVIATDAIGNGRSTSPSNSVTQPGMAFPRFTIRDMVAAQARLVREAFGIERLAAVVGASMGGMQALQWAVSHPDAMRAVVALVPLAKSPPWTRAVNETSRNILMADPAWNGREFTAWPARGFKAWADFMQAIVGRTPPGLAGLDASAFLAAREAEAAERRFAAEDWLYQTWAYDAHDVGTTPGFDGDTAAALRSVRARPLVLGPPLDLYNPVEEQRWAAAQIPGARFVEIPSPNGHFASNAGRPEDVAFMNAEIGAFLAPAT